MAEAGNIPCWSVNVNCTADFSIGVGNHWWGLLAPLVITPSFEMAAPMGWPSGKLLGKHNLSTTVTHEGRHVVLAGHDCGPFIFDLTIPLMNVYYGLMWPFSSRKTSFSASTVMADGTPIAITQLPLFPMTTCGDFASTPSAFSMISFLNTAEVGMTPADVAVGWMTIATSALLDVLSSSIGDAPTDLGKDFLGKLFPFKDPTSITKAALSSIFGLVITGSACASTGGEYPVTGSADTSNPHLGAGASVSYSKAGGLTGQVGAVNPTARANIANTSSPAQDLSSLSLAGYTVL